VDQKGSTNQNQIGLWSSIGTEFWIGEKPFGQGPEISLIGYTGYPLGIFSFPQGIGRPFIFLSPN